MRTGSPSWKDKEKRRNGSRVFTPTDTKLQRLEGKVHVSSENFSNFFLLLSNNQRAPLRFSLFVL